MPATVRKPKPRFVIPQNADAVVLTFPSGAWLTLHRDTTGRSRWEFRGFSPGQGPDPIASGVLTHVGAQTFADLAEQVEADGVPVEAEGS